MPENEVPAEQGDDDERQHDDRRRQQHVDEALDRQVDAPAIEGAGDTDQRAEDTAEEGRGEADDERGARAIDDAAQYVAAEIVGPKGCWAEGGEKMIRDMATRSDA